MDYKKFEIKQAALERKYSEITKYISLSDRIDPLSSITTLAGRLKKKEYSVALEKLELIGNYLAEFAILSAECYERRWGSINKRNESKSVEKEKRGDKIKGRRALDNHKTEDLGTIRSIEGYEELYAALVYDIIDPKKRDIFLERFFDDKTLKNVAKIGSYYRSGPNSNNNLMQTLIIGERKGKEIALKVADTLDTIRTNHVMRQRLSSLETFIADISRLHYLGGGEKSYNTYLGKILKEEPTVYREILVKDPRELFLYSGDLKTGVTFQKRLSDVKEEVLDVICARVYYQNDPDSLRKTIALRQKEMKAIKSKDLERDLEGINGSSKKDVTKVKINYGPNKQKPIKAKNSQRIKVDFKDPSLKEEDSLSESL